MEYNTYLTMILNSSNMDIPFNHPSNTVTTALYKSLSRLQISRLILAIDMAVWELQLKET